MKYCDRNISLKTEPFSFVRNAFDTTCISIFETFKTIRNAYISNIGFPIDFIGRFDRQIYVYSNREDAVFT